MAVWTIVAGSFNKLHKGHRNLINAAFEGSDMVTVGVSSDAFNTRTRKYTVPFETRMERVISYIDSQGFMNYDVVSFDNGYGDSVTNPNYTRIVVSEETYANAERINENRVCNGLVPLIIINIPLVMNEEGTKLSATDIMSGKFTDSGKFAAPRMEVVMLGTSGAMSTEMRKSAGILVKTGRKSSVLLDCGNETSLQMMMAHENPNTIEAIFISHAHLDHFSGLPIFVLHHMMLNGRDRPLIIYAPRGVIDAVQPMFDSYHIKPKFHIAFRLIECDDYMFNDLIVHPFYVCHSLPESYGFVLTRNGKRVVFSGDTQPCHAVYKAAEGADLLIHEATYTMDHEGKNYGHSTTYDAYIAATVAKAKKLVLTHISTRYQSDMDKYNSDVEELKMGSDLEIVVADDLDEFKL